MQRNIYIKGMVCDRCIQSVRESLARLDVEVIEIRLGELIIITREGFDDAFIEERLKPLGFSILEDKKQKLARDIKRLVEEVYSGAYDFPYHFKFSNLVAERFNTSYDAVSAVFSIVEQTTIEKYIFNFRIEKIKELLVYSNDTLATISFKLGFTSVAHLSRQFKLQTGLNPSHFRKIRPGKGSGDTGG